MGKSLYDTNVNAKDIKIYQCFNVNRLLGILMGNGIMKSYFFLLLSNRSGPYNTTTTIYCPKQSLFVLKSTIISLSIVFKTSKIIDHRDVTFTNQIE